jgi:WD40 repeat protein
METGQRIFPPLRTESNVVAIDASPDGRILVALCHDRSLLIIDPESGSILHRYETFPDTDFFYGFVIFRRLAFSPAGDRFAVWGSQSRTVEMRSAVDGSLLFTVSHSNEVSANFLHNVTFSPDGKKIATCSSDQTVQLFSAENGEQQLPPLLHSGWVFSAEFSRDGQRLLTACQDRQARLWDLQDVSKPVLITPAQNDEVYATCFLPGEEFFLIGLRNGEVSAWDAQQGKMISPGIVEPNQKVIYTLALSPDQSRVIIVGREPVIRGFHPSRWQPSVQQRLARDEIRSLGETIASQELFDGVLMGLTNEAVIDGWEQLYKQHAEHEIFRWDASGDILEAPSSAW